YSSSTSSCWSNHCTRVTLPCTCSSPPCFDFSSRICLATSPETRVLLCHCGSNLESDTTYFGLVLSASTIGLSMSVRTLPQYSAQNSYVRRPNIKASAL